MYEAHKITRFTYFHLIHNSEALFFNILIRTNHFRSKNDLLCATNNEKKSYPWMSRSSSQTWTIQEYLLQYAHRNLIDTYNRSQLLEQLLEDYPYLNHEHILQDIHVSIRYQKKIKHWIQNARQHILTTCSILILRIWCSLRNNNTLWTTLFKIHMVYISSHVLHEVKKFLCEIYRPIFSKLQ